MGAPKKEKLWEPKPVWELPPCPYENNTPKRGSGRAVVEWLVGLTLFLPRVLLVIFTVLAVYVVAMLTVIGWTVEPRPDRALPGYRYWLQRTLVPPLVRMNLFALGFHYITIKGRPVSRAEAPLLVANHQTFLDIWLWLWQLLPVGVSAAENRRFPVMGSIMKAFQTIFVDREVNASGKDASKQLAETIADPRYPQVVVYPEGNTGNGTSICTFKQGAFGLGVPVQPVVIKYVNPNLDFSWVEPLGTPLPNLVLRILLQPNNKMVVTYLPPMAAAKNESVDAFCSRVQRAMADAAGVPVTQYSFGDTALMFSGLRRYKMRPREMLLEMGRANKVYGVTTAECKECLEKFAAGLAYERKVAGDTSLQRLSSAKGMLIALGVPETRIDAKMSEAGEAVMKTLATTSAGTVCFREFVAGLATPAAEYAGEATSFYKRAVAHASKICKASFGVGMSSASA